MNQPTMVTLVCLAIYKLLIAMFRINASGGRSYEDGDQIRMGHTIGLEVEVTLCIDLGIMSGRVGVFHTSNAGQVIETLVLNR